MTTSQHHTSMSDDSPTLELFSNILAHGSSLNPTFLLIVDGVLGSLLLVLLSLLWVSSGNLHVFALVLIELCLWTSIKWCEKYISFEQKILQLAGLP